MKGDEITVSVPNPLDEARRYISHIDHVVNDWHPAEIPISDDGQNLLTEPPGKVLLDLPTDIIPRPGVPFNNPEQGGVSAHPTPSLSLSACSDLPVLASQTQKISENTHTHPHPQSAQEGCLDYPINAVEGVEARGVLTKLRSSRTPTR